MPLFVGEKRPNGGNKDGRGRRFVGLSSAAATEDEGEREGGI